MLILAVFLTNSRGRTVRSLLSILALAVLSACQTTQPGYPSAEAYRDEVYLPLLDQYTGTAKQYEGLHNKFEFKATLLNSKVARSQVELLGMYFQWDARQLNTKINQEETKLSENAYVFLSFFSPDTDIDDLAARKTPWRVYLENNGLRYEGRVKIPRELTQKLQKLYPYHDRWSKAFIVEFPVPMTVVEKNGSRLVLTGPVGSKTAEFTAL